MFVFLFLIFFLCFIVFKTAEIQVFLFSFNMLVEVHTNPLELHYIYNLMVYACYKNGGNFFIRFHFVLFLFHDMSFIIVL
jgi:hypothetical protein